jgi:hypothetical protein
LLAQSSVFRNETKQWLLAFLSTGLYSCLALLVHMVLSPAAWVKMKFDDMQVGQLIWVGPHRVNNGDVHGIFLITEKTKNWIMMQATDHLLNDHWTRIPRPRWMQNRNYCRMRWDFDFGHLDSRRLA